MRSCLLVKDATDDTPLCVITANEIYQLLCRSAEQLMLSGFRTALRGSGSEEKPYVLNTFLDINAYIEQRNERREGTFYFQFCGIDMFQHGNDVASEQKYYIGLQGDEPLSYPDMRNAIASDKVIGKSGFKAETVKPAVGLSTDRTYQLLALACLFIAEGRRDRRSLLTHLLLMDLIAAGVTYGSAGTKVRTLQRAVDIPKATARKWAEYGGLSAAGDSPLSQKDAVAHMKATTVETEVGSNRYFDKTVSIATQWLAHYFTSPKFNVEPCTPGDVRPEALGKKLDSHLDTTIEDLQAKGTLKKKSSEKAAAFGRRVEREREKLKSGLRGVPNEVKAYLGTMFDVRLRNARRSQDEAEAFVPLDPAAGIERLRSAVG